MSQYMGYRVSMASELVFLVPVTAIFAKIKETDLVSPSPESAYTLCINNGTRAH